MAKTARLGAHEPIYLDHHADDQYNDYVWNALESIFSGVVSGPLENREYHLEAALYAAGLYHGGQMSALYEFASSGSTTNGLQLRLEAREAREMAEQEDAAEFEEESVVDDWSLEDVINGLAILEAFGEQVSEWHDAVTDGEYPADGDFVDWVQGASYMGRKRSMRKEAIEPAFHEDLMRGSQMLEDFLRLLQKSHDRLIEAGKEFGSVQHFDGALNDISERLDAAEQATQMLLDRIDQEFDY